MSRSMSDPHAAQTDRMLQEAHLMMVRGETTRARRTVELLLKEQPDCPQAHDLLRRIEERETEIREENNAPVWTDRLWWVAGHGLQFLGVMCGIFAVWLVWTVVNPDMVRRYPRAGEPVFEARYYRKHFPIPEPVRLLLALPLGAAGVGLWIAGKRVNLYVD
jgi:hypothetical protein